MEPEQQSKELSHLLVKQCPDGIVFAGVNGRIERWNTAAEHIFGHTAEQVLGESLDIIIPEQLRARHWQGFEQAVQAGKTEHDEALPTKALRRDGSTIYVELSFAVVLDADGAALGALAQVRDITQRFQQERANRRRLRELEQQANAGNKTDDPDVS